ncbi:MAG: serine/threonine protein kinase [Pirellulaceae bacterium]|jgi:serine/threonine protein kinase|nr:serine/threonine protein kinase [Pirellulaceae bacterium]
MGSSVQSVFRAAALASRLITQDQLDRVEAAIRNSAGGTRTSDVTDEELAAKLVELDVLTSYQADQLKEGRSKLNLGPYIITDWIGQGGMGQVFKAVHEMMGRESAVKVLPVNKSTPQAIVNFTREIRTQAQLDHPNLVRAYDAGHDGNVYYLVTEFVPGMDLRKLIRTQGRPLSMQQAANIIRQAALGLHYAHQRGLLHRDVKPGNILVTPEGNAKVSDLGLAGFIHLADEDPRAGKIVGTADYLSPEQIRAPRDVTASSDIYSLGCTLYYAVTGKVPFPGGSTRDKARRHIEDTPWHPRRFNSEISEEFVEIIADMMEKDPAARLQSAAQVAARLEPWAADRVALPAQPMTKSPWMPPPLPTGRDELETQETHEGSYDADEVDWSRGSSQWSQGTDPLGAAGQDTLRIRAGRRRKPPLALSYPYYSSRDLSVPVALAVSIPVSLLVGIVLGFLLSSWLA